MAAQAETLAADSPTVKYELNFNDKRLLRVLHIAWQEGN
jgi:hypothetical protein